MTQKEFNQLHFIDEKWTMLQQESRGRIGWRGVIVPPDGDKFVSTARELAQLIHELNDTFQPAYYTENIGAVNSTLNGELKRVCFAEKRAMQSRATKKDKDEFLVSMRDVIGHFSRDYYGVFQKIETMKRDEQWETYHSENE